MGRLIVVLMILLAGLWAGCSSDSSDSGGDGNYVKWAYQLQDANPSEITTSGFKLVVMDYSYDGSDEGRYTPEEIGSIVDAGMVPIAYISIGEAEDYRFYWQDEWKSNPPSFLGPENPEWLGNYAVRYWDDQWQIIVFQYIDRIIQEGFRGIYLDKVDEFEFWSDPEEGEGIMDEESAARLMIDFIEKIIDYCREKDPDFYIIPQNGERLLEYDDGTLVREVSGWAAEDLFYDGTRLYSENEAIAIQQERFPYLDRVVDSGKFVLSVDYVDDGSGYEGQNLERIEDYIRRAKERGYSPYVARSDRELNSLVIIPGIQP